jgi:hypothetical protein
MHRRCSFFFTPFFLEAYFLSRMPCFVCSSTSENLCPDALCATCCVKWMHEQPLLRAVPPVAPFVHLCLGEHFALAVLGDIPGGLPKAMAQARNLLPTSIFKSLRACTTTSAARQLVAVFSTSIGEPSASSVLALLAAIPPDVAPAAVAYASFCPPSLLAFLEAKDWRSAEDLKSNEAAILAEAIRLDVVSLTVPFWTKVQGAPAGVHGHLQPDNHMQTEMARMSALFVQGGAVRDGPGGHPSDSDTLGAGVARLLLGKELDKKEALAVYKQRELTFNPLTRVWELNLLDPWRKLVSETEGLVLLEGPLQLLGGPGGKQFRLDIAVTREVRNLLDLVDLTLPKYMGRLFFRFSEIENDPSLQALAISYKRLEAIWAFQMRKNPPQSADAVSAWVNRNRDALPEDDLLSALRKGPSKGSGGGQEGGGSKCFSCGKLGHTRATCRSRQHTKPQIPAKGKGKGKSLGKGAGKRACFICGSPDHMADSCSRRVGK